MIKIGDSKVSVKDFNKWLNALRSGEYSQTKYKLQDDKGFCCLGVACDVFIPKDERGVHPTTGFLWGDLPDFQSYSPRWIKQVNVDFRIKTKHKWYAGQDVGVNDASYGLTALNDYLDFTFEEIADTLEAVYLWGVLDGKQL